MIRVLRAAMALLATSVVAAACYWGFLNTPESRGWMLALSAVQVLLLVAVIAVGVSTALLLAAGEGWMPSVVRGLRATHWFVIAAIVAAAGIWVVARVDGWFQQQVGPISAWFIATLNWGDVRWLFRSATYFSEWLRWIVWPLAALALLQAMLKDGARGLWSWTWIRAGWHWRTLVVATLAYALLFRIPWQWVAWRPAPLPANRVELAFAAVRLGVISALTLLAAALATAMVARQAKTT